MKSERFSSTPLRLVCLLLALITLTAFIPTFSIKADAATTAYDEYLGFEGQTVGNSPVFSATNITVSNEPLTVAADPKDSANTVIKNTGSIFFMCLKEKSPALHATDFIISVDFLFETFPTKSSADVKQSLLAWVQNDSKYMIFCRVDSKGNLLDTNNNSTGVVFTQNEWKNIAVHCDGATGAYDLYADGKYVTSGTCGTPLTSPTSAYVRIFNKSSSSADSVKAYVDNIQLYEAPRAAYTAPVDVIWDIDFEEFKSGVTPTVEQLNTMSSMSEVGENTSAQPDAANVYVSNAWTNSAYGKIAEDENGNKLMKMSGLTNVTAVDLLVGKGNFDPLKNGTVKLSFDFKIEADGKTRQAINLVRWKGMNASTSKPANQGTILTLSATGELQLPSGTSTGYILEEGKMYGIELIINNRILSNTQYIDITLSADDGNGMKTLVDSFPVWTASVITSENYAWFKDAADNKYYMPYTGFVKESRTVNGSTVYIDKFVALKNSAKPTGLRMFQCANASGCGLDIYVDALKIERIEDKPIISFGFEGWQKYSFSNMATQTGYRFKKDSSIAFETESDGNVYVSHPNTVAQKTEFMIGDLKQNFLGKNMYLETDVSFTDATPDSDSTTISNFIFITAQHKDGPNTSNPFGWDGTYTKYIYLLRVDGSGNLYTDSSASSKFAKLSDGGNKLGINFKGNGSYWTGYDVYIDGELAKSVALSSSYQTHLKNSATYSIRFRGVEGADVGFDNISFTEFVTHPEIPDVTLGFEDETEINETLTQLGTGWKYGDIGSERVTLLERSTADGVDKYIRIDHSGLTASKNAYLDVANKDFISEDCYLIETSVRYTANTSYGLNVAQVYRASDSKCAPLLTVDGDTNALYISLRGIRYDLVNSAGKPIYASKITDEAFTDVAILVDNVNQTYTLYVNGRLAYYYYNKTVTPCVNMPMHFVNSGIVSSVDFIRLLEIPNVKQADSTADIGLINVISMTNGLGMEIKGSQTRPVLKDNEYDVRFVSGIDSIYGSAAGYEITAEYTDKNGTYTKKSDVSSTLVFDKIEAADGEITAADLDSKHIVAIEIRSIPMEVTVKFTVKPYVNRGGIRICGENYTASFYAGNIVN